MADYNIYYKIYVQAESALKAFANIEKSLKNIAKYSDNVSKGLAGVSSSMKTVSNATNMANRSLAITANRLSTVKNGIAQVKNSFSGFATSLIGFSVFQRLIQPISDFEGAMAQVKSVATSKTIDNKGRESLTSLDPTQMLALRQQAMKIGSTTLMSDVDAGNAQVELAKLGMSYQQILVLGEPLAKFAIAGKLHMEQAASAAAVASNIFGVNIKSMSSLMDSMARTVNTSVIKAGELKKAFSTAGGAAAKAGLDYNQFLATLAAVNQKTGNTQISATGLKSSFVKLTSPNRNTLGIYKSLGIDYQKSFKSSGILGVIQQLHDKTKGLAGTTKYFDIMKNLFGLQTYVVGSNLVDSIDDVNKRIKDLGVNGKGSLDKINEALTQNSLPAAFNLMTSHFINADLALGRNGFTGTLIEVLNILAKVGKAIGELNPNIMRIIGNFILLTGALSSLSVAFFIMKFAFSPIMALFKGVGVVIGFIKVIWGLVAAMRALTMAEILANLANPLLWIAGGIALVAGLTLNFTKLGEKVEKILKGIKDKFMGSLFSNKGMFSTLESEIKKAKDDADKLLGGDNGKPPIITPVLNTSKLIAGMDQATAILSARFNDVWGGNNNKISFNHAFNNNKQTVEVNVNVHGTGSVAVSTPDGKTVHAPLQIATSSSTVGN